MQNKLIKDSLISTYYNNKSPMMKLKNQNIFSLKVNRHSEVVKMCDRRFSESNRFHKLSETKLISFTFRYL